MREDEDTRTLFTAASNDLKALEGMLDNPNIFSDEVFGFHAQQAVEKCLKTWISILGDEYPLTHGLNVLLLRLENLGCDVDIYWELTDLSPFGVTFRYSILDESEPPLNRRSIFDIVQSLYNHIAKISNG